MTRQFRVPPQDTPQRRASIVGERLSQQKLAEIRRMTPAQRLMLALQLSDTCYELQRACSPKR